MDVTSVSTAASLHPISYRGDSPSPDVSPTPAIGACPELSRCLSTASSASHGSSTDITSTRDSLGSDTLSRQSSASYQSLRSDSGGLISRRHSSYNLSGDAKSRRRGYARPQGTDFAASARSRESVLSLGSIAHIQHYFARTGLLDGKGAQLARKRQQERSTLDLSGLISPTLPKIVGTDVDSPYASMGNSPELPTEGFGTSPLVGSPIDESPSEPDYYSDEYDEADANMLPPTVSTYHHIEKPVPKPPTIEELKSELTSALDNASKALTEANANVTAAKQSAAVEGQQGGTPRKDGPQGWYELEGMHILDVMTQAIRAAKVYYTAHELPDRLDSIKSEKEVRYDLLAVMEVLRQTATREFAGGIRPDEIGRMATWLASVVDMLQREEEIEAAERAERESWTWLHGDWTGRETERELVFMASLVSKTDPLPEWTPIAGASELPTPFLKSLQNGVRLIEMHNSAVKKSRRRFGAIGSFHLDTMKPYRCADNLRYWAKAAELRWEVPLKIDALGIVYNSNPEVWVNFQDAIFKWCQTVRGEISSELGTNPRK